MEELVQIRCRFPLSVHAWLKRRASDRGENFSTVLRDIVAAEIERSEFQQRYGISDQLIQEVARKVASEVPPKSGT
ncbi:MAG: hypothetical protein GY757_33095 [bacterium]|nr:hypothetical protein [bacterium]